MINGNLFVYDFNKNLIPISATTGEDDPFGDIVAIDDDFCKILIQ